MDTLKKTLKQRFKELYPGKRLLAIQLNGFSHRVFFDSKTSASNIECQDYSGCMPEGHWPASAILLFEGIGHAGYQNNAKELLYILPNER